jgi:hypothetical protein
MTARKPQHFREMGQVREHPLGSRRRLERIRLRGNWSREAMIFWLSVLLILTVMIPWLVCHPPPAEQRQEPALRGLH